MISLGQMSTHLPHPSHNDAYTKVGNFTHLFLSEFSLFIVSVDASAAGRSGSTPVLLSYLRKGEKLVLRSHGRIW